nr:reverse transcriptase domain-containing protein [Tanacetum cinerariifolium]
PEHVVDEIVAEDQLYVEDASPTTQSPDPIRSLGYRATMIRLRAEAASTSHSPSLPPPFILSPTRSDIPLSGIPPPLPISAPTSSPPLQLPSTSRKEDRPEGFVTTIDREIRHDPEREVRYGIIYSWDEIVETLQGAPISTDTKLGGCIRDFETRVRRDMDEIYSRLSREAWVRSMGASDLARSEVMSIRTTVLGQTTEIRELHAVDRRRQIVTSEMLKADHRRFAEIRGLRITDRTRQRQLIQTLTVMQSLQRQKKVAPKRTTRSTAEQETTNTTLVTNAQLQAMIDQGVTVALAARDALRSTNGDDSHNSGTGELALLCGRMFPEESDKFDRYIGGLPDMIHGSVLKNNNNQGNQGGRDNAPAKVYAVGRVGTDPDSNVVKGTFLLNNRYASVLFDTGADKRFVSMIR